MAIYLVQHGKSVPKEENPERPLSEAGTKEVTEIAKRLNQYKVGINNIYHSNKLRAIQTAEILHKHCPASEGMHNTAGMNPNDDVPAFAKTINRDKNDMYVGHLPFMEKLISFLITGLETKIVFKYQNAGVVKLSYSEEQKHWYIEGTLLPQPV